MAHYAFLDSENVVVEVIAGKDETDTSHDWEQFYGEIRGMQCKRTSYNGNIRKNYAGIGWRYDPARDAFIPPQPFPSWKLNEQTCLWEPPVAYPQAGGPYEWDEQKQAWIDITANGTAG